MNGRCEGYSFTSADAEGLLRHRNSKINTDMGTKMLLYAACAIAALATIGCGKSGLDANGCRDDVKSEYYIRYCAERALGVVSYSNTTGTTTLNTGQSTISKFECTVGPVSKGFSASFSIDTGTGMVMPLRIECRKDDGPFVVKVESNNRASYVIE